MLRFNSFASSAAAARVCTRRAAVTATAAVATTTTITPARSFMTTTTTTSMTMVPKQMSGSALHFQRRAKVYINEKGQRIFASDSPTIIPELEQETTLYEFILKRIRAAQQDKAAVIQEETGEQYTYAQMPGKIEHVAEVLYSNGIRKGDGVCIAISNHIVFGPLVFGTLRLGAIVSTVNAVSDVETLSHYLATNKAKVVVGMKFYHKELEAAVDRVMRETNRSVKIIYPEDFMKAPSPGAIPADYDGLSGATLDDTVFIPFSSGTTGLPKGTQLTNRCLIANSIQITRSVPLTAKDVTAGVLPYFHIFAFTANLASYLTAGGTQVVMNKYTLDSFTACVEKYGVTMNFVAPPIVISLLKNAETYKHRNMSSLDALICAAAPLGVDVQKAMKKVLPECQVVQAYGMTEMSPLTNSTVRGSVGKPLGSVGPLCSDVEMRIVKVDDSQQSGADKSAGVDAAEGEEGEIWYRGPNQMKGYLNPEDTAKCMQDGWYRTGDIGRVDPATEELFITDRLKELIKYKGFQVSPASLENVLLDHPWVQDCIVVGVSDPRDVSFEVPRALVVLKSNLPTDDVINAVDSILHFTMKRCPPHMRLHGGLRIVKQIPKNASGKLLRRMARQQEVAYLKENWERSGGDRHDAAEASGKGAH
uniref:4-coumarate--CoA ligase n=1 Tax=Strigomonas galati TaxID=1003336 RepID=T1YTF1_9TRYP|nr:4-coumarate--CoA ligase [Strigomonas galati]